ncbi:helix-turn-helix domain-containing protein [Candidatus Woesearchaeota archaeon]|nr:helix-turn-helix domain-containing protein [Candidatus Woesearchaeota archaeon]
MAKKDTFLLVSLQEEKAKEVAQIISNKSSRKILDFLAAAADATETQIAKALGLPISTVHYNLEALKKAKLVESEEFHYSSKGKEVSHYKLANKYIIIAPKSVHGIKGKLRNILPLGIATAAVAYFISLLSKGTQFIANKGETYRMVVEEAASGTAGTAAVPEAVDAAEVAVQAVTQQTIWQNPVLWFVVGAAFAIGLYFLIEFMRRKR